MIAKVMISLLENLEDVTDDLIEAVWMSRGLFWRDTFRGSEESAWPPGSQEHPLLPVCARK